eukprot:PhF_6_TR36078/c0_g1_i2/m.52414
MTSTSVVNHLSGLVSCLQTHHMISETTMSHITQRERLMREVRSSCVCNANVLCNNEGHVALYEVISEVDNVTSQVVRCIMQWRDSLNNPLPFPYQGENYIFRIIDDAPLVKRVVYHLQTQSRGLQGQATTSTCKWGQARLLSTALEEWGRDTPEEIILASKEYELQLRLVEKGWNLARRGQYVPVLRYHGRSAAFVESLKWKEDLMLLFSSARHMLQQRSVGKTQLDLRSLANEFASFNHRAGFGHYWNLWYQFASKRSSQKRAVAKMSENILLARAKVKYEIWRSVISVRVAQKSEQLRQKILSSKDLFKRYLRKWYYYRCLRMMARTGRMVLLRRYYQSLLYVRNSVLAQKAPIVVRHLWSVAAATPSTPPQYLHSLIHFHMVERPRFEIQLAEYTGRRDMVRKIMYEIHDIMWRCGEDARGILLRQAVLTLSNMSRQQIVMQEANAFLRLENENEMLKTVA